jgi:hypothetical protein
MPTWLASTPPHPSSLCLPLLVPPACQVACCTEVPAFRFQGKLLEQVSLDSVVHLVLLTIALRLGLYGALPGWGSVWGVLPVELLHGITYALAFGCGTMYASKVAPPGRGASMQVGRLVWLLGHGNSKGVRCSHMVPVCSGTKQQQGCFASMCRVCAGALEWRKVRRFMKVGQGTYQCYCCCNADHGHPSSFCY